MRSTSMRFGAAQEHLRRADWTAAAIWLLCFGLVAYLGFEGGGYDPLVHDRVAIGLWWVMLVGVLIGALPRRRPPAAALVALGLLAAFVAWTALSLGWTESIEKTWADLARVGGYLAAFALALAVLRGGDARRVVGAVGAAVALVALLALLSRLHPSWFPAADETARFVSSGRERLSYPLQYWNALAALIAVGAPLLLAVATGSRSLLLRAVTAAALPAIALAAFLTLSRSGIAACLIVLAAFLALAADRLPKLLALLTAGAGGAILIAAATGRDALQHGLDNALARQQGDEVLLMTLAVCLAVGLIHGAVSSALLGERRPRWTVVPRRHSLIAAAAAGLALLIALAALDAPGRAADGWDEFRQGGGPGRGAERLGSVAGESRYSFWSAAVRQAQSEPLTGTGSGTFEYWWARDGDVPEIVRDTHSLYLQTLGELGIVGIALLAAFLLTVLAAGTANALRAGGATRSVLAAAVAGCLAFCLTATFDWLWQIPAVPVAMLLLAAALLGAAGGPPRQERRGRAGLPLAPRLAIAAIAAAAIAVTAIPLAATILVRESKEEALRGDLPAALESARSAQNVQPRAATPHLQQALVLEEMGDFAAAAAAARAATDREPTNWRHWLVLSRTEAELGRPAAAVRDFRRARSLNPYFSLFQR